MGFLQAYLRLPIPPAIYTGPLSTDVCAVLCLPSWENMCSKGLPGGTALIMKNAPGFHAYPGPPVPTTSSSGIPVVYSTNPGVIPGSQRLIHASMQSTDLRSRIGHGTQKFDHVSPLYIEAAVQVSRLEQCGAIRTHW